MIKKIAILSVIVLAVIENSFASPKSCSLGEKGGLWSSKSIDISPSKPGGKQSLRICSPDGRSAVVVKDEAWWLEVGDSRKGRSSELPFHSEIGWSPDGKAFYMTTSEGYTTGFRTNLFLLRNDKLKQLQISDRIAREFQVHHDCYDRKSGEGNLPNVIALTWIRADRLLLVAEVPNLGICGKRYLAGYTIETSSGKIVERLSPAEISQRFADAASDRLKDDLRRVPPELIATKP